MHAAWGSQLARVLAYVAEHPGAQPNDVAAALGVGEAYVRATFNRQGIAYRKLDRCALPKADLLTIVRWCQRRLPEAYGGYVERMLAGEIPVTQPAEPVPADHIGDATEMVRA